MRWSNAQADAQAFVIFDTFSECAATPTVADFLMNWLLRLSQEHIFATQRAWAAMMRALDVVEDDDEVVTSYIRHLWSARYGLIQEQKLYTSITRRIRSKQAAVGFVQELAENVPFYVALLQPQHEKWARYGAHAQEDIRTLRLLKIEQFQPLLLAVLAHFTDDEVGKTLRLLGSWSVRVDVMGVGSSQMLAKHAARSAKKVWKGHITTAPALSRTLRARIPV